jgi:hypothetical protein
VEAMANNVFYSGFYQAKTIVKRTYEESSEHCNHRCTNLTSGADAANDGPTAGRSLPRSTSAFAKPPFLGISVMSVVPATAGLRYLLNATSGKKAILAFTRRV